MTRRIDAFELSGFQRDLLYVIVGSERPSGQDISRELENYTDVGRGRLYRNLDVLVESELVKKGAKDQRANYYAITNRGGTVLRDRRAWENNYLTELPRISVCQR